MVEDRRYRKYRKFTYIVQKTYGGSYAAFNIEYHAVWYADLLAREEACTTEIKDLRYSPPMLIYTAKSPEKYPRNEAWPNGVIVNG